MLYFKPDSKKEIYQYLNDRIDEIRRIFQFPEDSWKIDLPDIIKKQLRTLAEDFTNINEKEKTFLINCIIADTTDPEKVSFLERDTFWRGFKTIDLLADYIYHQNNSFPNDTAYAPILTRMDRGFKEIFQSLKITERFPDPVIQENFNFQKMKPGKFLKKLFPDATAQQCEEFQQVWVSHFKKWSTDALLLTDELLKYYNGKQYATDRGPLGASCMRYDNTSELIYFYVKNNIRMVIFPDPNNPSHIRARALVWDNIHLDNVSQKRYNLPPTISWVDRIYFNTEQDRLLVEAWAAKNGYYRKAQHRPDWHGMICPDGKLISNHIKMSYKIKEPSGPYPYIDSFPYLIYNESEDSFELQNHIDDIEDYLELQDTDGSYSGRITDFPTAAQKHFRKTTLPDGSRISKANLRICLRHYQPYENIEGCPVCEQA